MEGAVTGQDATQSTGADVRSGLKWVSLSLGLAKASRILTMFVLADLLTKEAFGLVAMATIVVTLMGVLREMGFSQAYIYVRQQGANSRRAINTMFVLSSLIGVVLFAIAFFAAPWIASLFKEATGLDWVLRAMLVGFLIHPFTTTPSCVLQKEMKFRQLSYGEISDGFTYCIVGIALAFAGFGVWSIVIAYIASRVVAAIVLISAAGWRPSIEFDRGIAAKLFTYGKYLWGLSIISTVGSILDRGIIARTLGTTLTGTYQIAYSLCVAPAVQASFVVNRVAFPAMSRMQDDLPALRRAFIKVLSHVTLVAMPVALGIIAVSDTFVRALWADKWVESVPVINVLALYGLTLALGAVTTPALKAAGKPNVLMWTSLGHFVLLMIAFGFAWGHGMVAVAWATVIPLVLGSAVAVYLMTVYLACSTWDVLGPFVRTGAAALLMFFAVRWFQVEIAMDLRVELAAAIVVGAGVYVIASLVFNKRMFDEVTETLKETLRKRRQKVS
jgi:O-antigen/teichoic acid export membrane protein